MSILKPAGEGVPHPLLSILFSLIHLLKSEALAGMPEAYKRELLGSDWKWMYKGSSIFLRVVFKAVIMKPCTRNSSEKAVRLTLNRFAMTSALKSLAMLEDVSD